jgi:RHS repeat-associated protein
LTKDNVIDYNKKLVFGNVRTVVTEQNEPVCYIAATSEDTRLSNEQKIYDIVSTRRKTLSDANIPSSYTQFESKVYETNGSDAAKRIGLGAVIKVMSGDNVSLTCQSYYNMPVSGRTDNNYMAITDLLSAFVSSGGVVAKGAMTSNQVYNYSTNATNLSPFLQSTPQPYTANSYLNWIVFDEQMKYVAGGADPVNPNGGYKLHVPSTIPITKNGFLYVYVSNESNYPVYFDNLSITHTPGAIVEETHYYPFGLTMAGISSRAAGMTENKKKFNAGSELQDKEFSDGSGLELYATQFRMYDPQLGRWHVIDPKPDFSQSLYSAMGNNPILFNDPMGDTTFLYSRQGSYRGYIGDKKANEVVIAKSARIIGLKIGMALGKKSVEDAATYARSKNFADGRITSNTVKELTAQWTSGKEKIGFLYADNETKEVHISICQSCKANEGSASLSDVAKTYQDVSKQGNILGMWHTHPEANSFAGHKPSWADSKDPSSNISAFRQGSLGMIVNKTTASIFPIHPYAGRGDLGNHDQITTPKFGPGYLGAYTEWQYGTFNNNVNSKSNWER